MRERRREGGRGERERERERERRERERERERRRVRERAKGTERESNNCREHPVMTVLAVFLERKGSRVREVTKETRETEATPAHQVPPDKWASLDHQAPKAPE